MKKEKLYITELIDNPQVTYPMTYSLSSVMINNDNLKATLIAIHSFEFDHYAHPASWYDLYRAIDSGGFVIYKERYAVSEFGGRLMCLEAGGWCSLNITRDSFDMRFWLV